MSNFTDKYWNDKKNYDKNHPVEMIRLIPTENPNINIGILKQNIENMDNLNETELRNMIGRSLKSILKNLFGKEAHKYARYFQNLRFLDAFIDVISTINYIEKDDVVRINTLCYHYITLPNDKKDYKVTSRMMKISRIVNKHSLPSLLGLGLSENLACTLLIARYSDIDLEICVKRVDFIIMTQPKTIMSLNMIEEIIKRLYNIMEDYFRIFPYFMMDVIPDYDDNDETTWWVTEDVDEVSSTMNLAMLNIMDNLPSQLIRNTIVNYTEGCDIVYKNRKLRFSLRSLSDDYYRINAVIEHLMYNEGIIVP